MLTKSSWFVKVLLTLLALMVIGHATVAAQPPNPNNAEAVARQIAALAAPLVGEIGMAVTVVGGDEALLVNSDGHFPMASTFKLPLAIALLRRVDEGTLSLDTMVEIIDRDLVFSAGIPVTLPYPGVALSLKNLLYLMIAQSDNTATDAAMRLLGGAEPVMQSLRELGIKGLSVNRSTGELMLDYTGLQPGRESFGPFNQLVADGLLLRPDPSLESDLRDQTTPAAMLDLLVKLAQGQALSPMSTEFLMATLGQTTTAPGRIGGRLPPGSKVAHKSGSVMGVANDVGYITLPDGRLLAIACYTKTSTTPLADRDRAIAETSRLAYDYFFSGNP